MRVQLGSEAMPPISIVDSPGDWNHSGA